MDKLPTSTPSRPSAEMPDTFSLINRSDSTSSNASSTTRETISSTSNSPNTSHSRALRTLEGTTVSFIPNPTLPPHLRERILSNTPGTSRFATETRIGTVHPARATQTGRPAATIEAATQRRNPQPLSVPRIIHIQNPETIRLLAQSRFQQKPYFFPPKTAPKRTD